MKNMHVLPTDKPSRLAYDFYEKFYLLSEDTQFFEFQNLVQNRELYIISDEKPKQGEWSLYQNKIHKCIEDIIEDEFKKIILTTDQDLIKDGVQAIDDKFLEWFVKNPSCEEVKTQLKLPWESSKDEYEIIIPKEERSYSEEKFKQENTIEEAAEGYSKQFNYAEDSDAYSDFIQGAKWQQERSYSEEEVLVILYKHTEDLLAGKKVTLDEWFEQFKKL